MFIEGLPELNVEKMEDEFQIQEQVRELEGQQAHLVGLHASLEQRDKIPLAICS